MRSKNPAVQSLFKLLNKINLESLEDRFGPSSENTSVTQEIVVDGLPNSSQFLTTIRPPIMVLTEQFLAEEETFPSKKEYAFFLYRRLLLAKKGSDALFLLIGRILKEIRDKKLYTFLDYESFRVFIYSEDLGFSRETAYLYIRAYEYFIEHLSLNEEIVTRLNIGKINRMIPVLKKIEQEKGRDGVVEELERLSFLRSEDFSQAIDALKKSTRPSVLWSEEHNAWVVYFFEDKTMLINKGSYDALQNNAAIDTRT